MNKAKIKKKMLFLLIPLLFTTLYFYQAFATPMATQNPPPVVT